MIQLIDPRGTTANEWCDRMTLELEPFGQAPIFGLTVDWKTWAREVSQMPRISGLNPPNPDEYSDEGFEQWALDFNASVAAGD